MMYGNIKYEYLKTNTRKSFVDGKLDELSSKGRSPSPPTVDSPHSHDSSIRQISLSPPRRSSASRLSPFPSPRAVNMPSSQGRRVSFVRQLDVGDPYPNTYADAGQRGRTKERKQSPPKWAKGKKEWNPEKLMDFWTKAVSGSPTRRANGTVKPTDVIDSFWQSHYGDVCPYKLKLPEKKAVPRQHITPKPRYVATKHKTNTRTGLALPDISPWKEKVTTMPRPVTADLAGRLAVRSLRGDTQRLRREKVSVYVPLMTTSPSPLCNKHFISPRTTPPILSQLVVSHLIICHPSPITEGPNLGSSVLIRQTHLISPSISSTTLSHIISHPT